MPYSIELLMEEPVGNCWVLLQGLAAAGAGVRVIGTDEACKLWPLEVGRTVCVEMVGRPIVSDMAMRRLRCLNQYCLVPRREVA